jgi:membrane dipeptidase
LTRAVQNGAGVQVLALFAPDGPSAYAQCLAMLDELDGAVGPARGDLRRYGDVSILTALEGAHVLDGDLNRLRRLRFRGVSVLCFTWNNDNALCGGIARNAYGLTALGRSALALWEGFGGVVDLSHASEPGFWDILDACASPPIASHSCCRALCAHRRNLTDEQLRALGCRGGVVGINFCPAFLRDDGRAALDDVLDHIQYALNAAGEAAVGLGSDFDGISRTPAGLPGTEALPRIAEGLSRRGVCDRIVQAVLGGNFRRLFREAGIL